MPTRIRKRKTLFNRWLLLVALLCGAGLAHAHHPHDVIDALAISPRYSEDSTLFIANAEHLMRSTNGGYSWKELVNGLDNVNAISDIVIIGKQGQPLEVYLSTLGDGVYRSTDGGDSWTRASDKLDNPVIHDLSAAGNSSVFAVDDAGSLYTRNSKHDWRRAVLPEGTSVTSVSSRLAPDTDRVLAGTRSGAVFMSRDDGESWQPAGRLPVETAVTVIEADISDSSGDSYFVGTGDHGLYRTADAGASFELLDNGLPGGHITSLDYSPDYANDHTLVVTTWKEAAYVSSDAGASWQHYSDGLSTDKQANTPKYFSPQFRAVRMTGNGAETLFLSGFDGLFRSADGGRHWEQLETLAVGLIKSLDISPPDADNNYSLALGTYGGGAYISRDHGQTWTIGNHGLKTTRLGDITFSPDYPRDNTLFAGSVFMLLQSTDGGASWEKIPLSYNPWRKRIVGKLIRMGLPRDIGEKFLEHRDHQPVYPSAIGISPDYPQDKVVLIGTRYQGLFRMQVDSREYETVWDDAPAAITDLVFSPEYKNDHTAFLFVRGDSIYKSTDGGQSWRRITRGLPFASAHTDLAELFTANEFSLAFSPSFREDQTLYGGGPMGLFRSTDAGESWQSIDNATLGSAPNVQALAIAPGGGLMVVSVKGRGLFHSQDGGEHFEPYAGALIEDNQSIELLAFSPTFAQDDTLYAASDQGLFRSVDRGATWKALSRPVRYEDRRDAIHYTGEWRAVKNNAFSASTIHTSSATGARASLHFDGCAIRWLARRSPEGGVAEVHIDGLPAASVDLHAEATEPVSTVFERRLDCGPHTLEIGTSTDAGNKGEVNLDAFDVLPKDE